MTIDRRPHQTVPAGPHASLQGPADDMPPRIEAAFAGAGAGGVVRGAPKRPDGEHWPVGRYAPGSYMCICMHCGHHFGGDKRACECPDCIIQELVKRLAAAEAERDGAESVRDSALRDGNAMVDEWEKAEQLDRELKEAAAQIGALRSALLLLSSRGHSETCAVFIGTPTKMPAQCDCNCGYQFATYALDDTAAAAREHRARVAEECAGIADEIGKREIFEDPRGFCRATSKTIAQAIRSHTAKIREGRQ